MKRTTETGMWLEYLGIINMMAETPGMYIMDSKRQEHHEELTDYYLECFGEKFEKEKFADICHDLNTVIDFNPPIEKYESLKYYSREIVKYMWGWGRKFCTGQVSRMNV